MKHKIKQFIKNKKKHFLYMHVSIGLIPVNISVREKNPMYLSFFHMKQRFSCNLGGKRRIN